MSRRSAQLSRVMRRDNRTCGSHLGGCGRKLMSKTDATRDHIIPRSFIAFMPPDRRRDLPLPTPTRNVRSPGNCLQRQRRPTFHVFRNPFEGLIWGAGQRRASRLRVATRRQSRPRCGCEAASSQLADLPVANSRVHTAEDSTASPGAEKAQKAQIRAAELSLSVVECR